MRIIQQLHGQLHTLGAEVYYQRIPLEITLIVGIELDPGLLAIDLLGNHAAAGKDLLDLLGIDVGGEVSDIDGSVLALGGGFGGDGFFGWAASYFLF